MITAASWVLFTTVLFNDGKRQETKLAAPDKETCIWAARNEWHKFYGTNLEDRARLDTLCRWEFHYDFVRIICTKDGICDH